MKRIILSVFVLLACVSAVAAQENLFDAFVHKASNSLLTVSYQYSTVLSGVNTTGNGSFSIQGSSYRHSGSGLEIWCDGSTIWTADPAAKEMVVESVTESSSPFVAGATLVLVSPDSSFKVVNSKQTGDGTQFHLLPEISCGVKDCYVTFSGNLSNPVIRKAVLTLDDGTVFRMTFEEVSFSPELRDRTFFRPGELGTAWVVTDLR